MKADILTVRTLFQKDVQYVIPIFQRPYVWNQEDQWEPLWDDVRNVAEEYLEQLAKLGEDKKVQAEQATGSHFMGAVVLQQQPTPTRDLEKRNVIDGQQRLITLQLLLRAAHKVFESAGYTSEARQMRKLIFNDEDYAANNHDDVFKVWPNLVDQEAFRAAMADRQATASFQDSLIVQAHEFFKVQIGQWLGDQGELAGRRAEALATALMGLFTMVVIDLDFQDDANIIFETLNARGTPLLDSDLVKNSILYMADQAQLNSKKIFHEYWEQFDQKWWRTEVRQGLVFRPRIDVFLYYWLTMRTREEITATRLFPRFRDYAKDYEKRLTELTADIKAMGQVFRDLHTINDYSPAGMFLYRWQVMEAGAATPVILWLFARQTELGAECFISSLRFLESYLVRRMICRMSTKGYNRIFLDMLGKLHESCGQKIDEVISAFLAAHTIETYLWPSDARVREVLLSQPLYQLLTRGRLRMVLEGLEDALRSPKTEEKHVKRGVLTIEHLMPQDWRKNWPLRPQDRENDLEAAERRDRLIHTIGNLTLVNRRLNPALSNAPWEAKRTEIAKHSVLYLNKGLLDQAPESWDEDAIEARGKSLADLFITIWPGPPQVGP